MMVWTRSLGGPRLKQAAVLAFPVAVSAAPAAFRFGPLRSAGARAAANLVELGEGRLYSRHLVDRRRIRVVGGHGGNGSCQFKKHGPHHLIGPGYPVGGHGGKGGDVVLKATANHMSLAHLAGHVLAGDGLQGKKKRINGSKGEDAVLPVPRGVVVHELIALPDDSHGTTAEPTLKGDGRASNVGKVVALSLLPPGAASVLDAASAHTSTSNAGDADGLPKKVNCFQRGRVLADLDKVGDTLIVAEGGAGGRGNNMATPYAASEGLPGEERYIELELKMIADVGLIGLPNAGKSTLLGAVTRATPKIAPYPFTTVAPYVGQVYFQDGSSFTIADVPGLVENAHLGAGLGHDFLRHLERTRMLLFVIDAARSKDPLAHFLALRREVALFSEVMAAKPYGIVANKCDVSTPSTLPRVDELHRALMTEAPDGNPPVFVRALSARFGDGVAGLLQEVRSVMQGTHAGLLLRQRGVESALGSDDESVAMRP